MILSENVILTAAHCLDVRYLETLQKVVKLPWYVATKEHNFDDTEEGATHKICKVLLHDNWDYEKLDYDFALLYLKDFITLGRKAKKVLLPTGIYNNPNFLTEKTLRVSGWGKINKTSVASGLRAVDVKAISNFNCQYHHYFDKEDNSKIRTITDRMLCAGDENGNTENFDLNKDSCSGDSGGRQFSIT
jgi:secreted trypsin-like serine protease